MMNLLVADAALSHLAFDIVRLEPFDLQIISLETTLPPAHGDCLLLDGALGVDNVLAEVEQRRIDYPKMCPWLVIAPDSLHDVVSYLYAGCCGILQTGQTLDGFVAIMQRIRAGRIYLDQVFAQQLAMRQIKKLLAPFAALTSREFDVFCLLAEGCSLATVAVQLGVSRKTVSNCQSQLKLKLNLDNRQAIAALAKSHGLID